MLQHAATRCNTLRHLHLRLGMLVFKRTATHCNMLQYSPTHCSTLQHIFTCTLVCSSLSTLQHAATCCNMLQHTATHFLLRLGMLVSKRAATHCNMLQYSATHCSTLQHIFTCALVCSSLSAPICLFRTRIISFVA